MSINDKLPDPEEAPWVSVLACSECGSTGRMYSTHEPRDEQYWTCKDCDTVDAEHNVIMKTNTGQEVER